MKHTIQSQLQSQLQSQPQSQPQPVLPSTLQKDPTGLDQLHDIIVPAPASLWPPAPGWIWVLSICAILLVIAIVWWAIRWQQNRYRREALAELARLETLTTDTKHQSTGISTSPGISALSGMSVLLKRTAITAFPRTEVATLTGTAWFTFLDRTGGTHFSQGLGATWEAAIYLNNGDTHLNNGDTYLNNADTGDAAQRKALITEIRTWIHNHQPSAAAEQTSVSNPEAV